jgi:hypothetical protein
MGRAARIPNSSSSTVQSVEVHLSTRDRNSGSSCKNDVVKGPYLEVVSDRYAGRGY